MTVVKGLKECLAGDAFLSACDVRDRLSKDSEEEGIVRKGEPEAL